MAVKGLTKRAGRAAMAISTTGFMVGLAFLNTGSAQSIGGLCNGQPASHTWLDASGQPGPAILDGTGHDDTIIGSDGDDTIEGRDTVVSDLGNDTVAGGHNRDFLVGGPGDDVMISSDDDSVDKVDGGEDLDDCLFSAGDELANCEY